MPDFRVIAGPNGAGKTKYFSGLFPDITRFRNFMNVDQIAEQLSPLLPESVSLKAGRLMLEKIKKLQQEEQSFVIETTLSGRTYLNTFKKLKQQGYEIYVYFLWVNNVQICIDRVAQRVKEGGHDIPEAIIRRRFNKGISNLVKYYWAYIDSCDFYDNSDYTRRKIVARYRKDQKHPLVVGKNNLIIYDTKIFDDIRECAENYLE